MLVVLVVLVM
jgi:hypothetical protein